MVKYQGLIVFSLCFIFRMRSQTVKTLSTKGGDSSVRRRFGVLVQLYYELYYFTVFLSFSAPPQATNMRSNGSSLGHEREPKENKVRSMASQLQAKFENKSNFTTHKTQVKYLDRSNEP